MCNTFFFRQTKEELEQVRGNAIRIENLAREQYRSITLDGSSLSEAREFLLQTTPNTTKSRRTYSWTPQEKETAFYGVFSLMLFAEKVESH